MEWLSRLRPHNRKCDRSLFNCSNRVDLDETRRGVFVKTEKMDQDYLLSFHALDRLQMMSRPVCHNLRECYVLKSGEITLCCVQNVGHS